jgi:STE24 endopeptidase
MHLQIITAFALLLWWPEGGSGRPWITAPSAVYGIVVATPLVVALLAGGLSLITRVRLRRAAHPQAAMALYHRGALLLRLLALASLAGHLLLTDWPRLLADWPVVRHLPGLAQLLLLVPYLLALAAIWWMLYPVERTSRDWSGRDWSGRDGAGDDRKSSPRWRYLVFNFRHQVLIVALPLAIIVVTYAVTRAYREPIISATGSKWTPEAIVGAMAIAIFVFSPILLRRVWATSPLPEGPLRTRLLALCDRIGLRVREILVWHSDGVMVNAAVMGLFPRVRYIMLSDTLLESMTTEEVEAVFGHEAGHVRHHHIPYFVTFAFVSMLIVSGVIEFLVRYSRGPNALFELSDGTIQAIGLAAIVPIWGIGFGWVSRRFERQADVFGAMCASPPPGDAGCRMPCTVHDLPHALNGHAVCATGAGVFVKALHKVALLNGIPPTERSWRHSSIAARMRFLTALTGDPQMARRFARCVRIIKLTLLACAAIGMVVAAIYLWYNPGYRREISESILEPLGKLLP